MSKYLKSLITACLVVCMTVCLGIFAAACTDDDGKDTFPSSVSITVKLDDDTPVEGAFVGICVVLDNGSLGACLSPIETNAQGVSTFDETVGFVKENGKNYEIHFYGGIPKDYAYVDEFNVPYAKDTGMRIDVTKTSNVTVTLVSTIGTEDNKKELTLGQTADFSVKLVETNDTHAPMGEDGKLPKILVWNREGFYATFKTTAAGNYKVTVVVGLSNDEVDPYLYTTDSEGTPICPDLPEASVDGNNLYFTYSLLADKTYVISLSSSIKDYKTLVNNSSASLNYSFKVEYLENN